MYSRLSPDPQIFAIARRQAGVLSLAQLERVGMPSGAGRRWKRDWVQMDSGVYCILEPTWLSWCWAAILYGGPSAVVGGVAAAYLLGAASTPPKQITAWHGGTSALKQMGDSSWGVTFRRADRTGRGQPPRTAIDVTLLDVAAETTENETVAMVTRAFSQGLTTSERLLAAMGQRPRTARRPLLHALCQPASGGIESVLEWRFQQVVLAPHRLPEPSRQQRLIPGTRADAVWQDQGVVVELDGRLGHEEAFRDMSRDNQLALSGMQTLRYGWHDVTERPCEVASQLHEVLVSRGWSGGGRRCVRCQDAGVS